MRVRITMPSKDGKQLKEKILESADKVEEDEFGQNDWELIMLIDPGQFKVLTELLQTEVKGRGRMETMNQTVTGDTWGTLHVLKYAEYRLYVTCYLKQTW